MNELLKAERAGVETLSKLLLESRSPEMRKLFEQVRDDEAWPCAGLAHSIKTLGGILSETPPRRDAAALGGSSWRG